MFCQGYVQLLVIQHNVVIHHDHQLVLVIHELYHRKSWVTYRYIEVLPLFSHLRLLQFADNLLIPLWGMNR